MHLLAQETALINFTLHQISIAEHDKENVREICALLLSSTEGSGAQKKFIDGDIAISSVQKAFIINAMKSLSWTKNQWDIVDAVMTKLNA